MTAEFDADVPVGFSANLNAASLSDLVQMHCLSGARCVARVNSGEEVGYLYFREGRVVHAMSPSHVGEPAALEILPGTRLVRADKQLADASRQQHVSRALLRARSRGQSGAQMAPFLVFWPTRPRVASPDDERCPRGTSPRAAACLW